MESCSYSIRIRFEFEVKSAAVLPTNHALRGDILFMRTGGLNLCRDGVDAVRCFVDLCLGRVDRRLHRGKLLIGFVEFGLPKRLSSTSLGRCRSRT